MKQFFYKYTTLIFGINGLLLLLIQHLLVTNSQTQTTKMILILFSTIVYFGGGVYLGQIIQRLYSLTNMDYLTGVSNRKKLYEDLVDLVKQNEKNKQELSLLMIDLDNFKIVNDTFGHPVGDTVLIHAAKLFQEEVRKSDIVARIGGEEFAIILPNTKLQEATEIAERIRCRIEREVFPFEGKKISISIGVSSIEGNDSIDRLFQLADEALYLAKNERNNVITLN